MKYGNIFVYGGHALKEQFDIIDTEDYKLRINKTWIDATNEWHIKITSSSIYEHSFEMFLTHEQIKQLKDIL